MGEAKMVELSQEELQGLIGLIDDTIERKLTVIKERMVADYFIAAQYDKPEVWEGIKELVVSLVKSDLALIRARFAALVCAPPVEPEEAKAPVEEAPEEKPAAEA